MYVYPSLLQAAATGYPMTCAHRLLDAGTASLTSRVVLESHRFNTRLLRVFYLSEELSGEDGPKPGMLSNTCLCCVR